MQFICIFGIETIRVLPISTNMKATELIKALQEEVNAKGDKEIVIAANRHSYRNVKLVTKDDTTTLALFDKVQD